MTKFLLMVNHDNGVFDDVPMDEWEPGEVKAHMDYYEILNRRCSPGSRSLTSNPRSAPSRSPPVSPPCPVPAASLSSSQ
jgi:hypothetical protein